MAPRKSTKSPETTEVQTPVKAAVKPRARKAAAPKVAPKVEAAAAPVTEPTKASRPGRKPKAPAAPPQPVPEIAQLDAPQDAPRTLEARETDVTLSVQVQALLAAIQEGRAVEFLFADAETNPPRTFEPRQLIFDVFTRAWFVWGWDRRYNAERHHRVDLLAEVNAVEGMGRAAQGPFKDGTPANQLGGWLGGEPIPVKAVLLKQWIYAVKQAPAPFPEFKLEDLEEGKAQASFVATDLRAIAKWCMQFGDGIQVLEPQRLIDRIKQVGVTWAGKPVQAAAPVPQPKPAPEPRHEARHEARPEARQEHHRRTEHPRHEPKEDHEPRSFREPKESESPKHKPGKIEIRIDRL